MRLVTYCVLPSKPANAGVDTSGSPVGSGPASSSRTLLCGFSERGLAIVWSLYSLGAQSSSCIGSGTARYQVVQDSGWGPFVFFGKRSSTVVLYRQPKPHFLSSLTVLTCIFAVLLGFVYLPRRSSRNFSYNPLPPTKSLAA